MQNYIEYIVDGAAMRLDNFSLAEARCHGKNPDGSIHDCGLIILEPDLLLCLGLVRVRYDGTIFVSSWTRCREHNSDVGGVETSKHPQGRALDLMPAPEKNMPRLRRICDEVFPYTMHHDRFIHCDLRDK